MERAQQNPKKPFSGQKKGSQSNYKGKNQGKSNYSNDKGNVNKKKNSFSGGKPTYSQPNGKGNNNYNKGGTSLLKRKREDNPVEPRKLLKTNMLQLRTDMRKLWERTRLKNITATERSRLIDELMTLVTGRISELILKHDSSRVFQTVLKQGTTEQKAQVLTELKGHYVELSKSTYGKFLCLKALTYGDKVQKQSIIKEFAGSLTKLLRHREASSVLDTIYSDFVENGKQRALMLKEFYGPLHVLYQETMRNLEDFLKAHPDKRKKILDYLQDYIGQLIDKSVLHTSISHRIILEFIKNADPPRAQDILNSLREHILTILVTRDGAEICHRIILSSSLKERTKIAKSFKGYVLKIACEEYGHQVLLSLLSYTDDTVVLQKFVLQELMKNLEALFNNKYCCKVLLLILVHPTVRHFPPFVVNALTTEDENRKKEPEKRRGEIFSFCFPSLREYCVSNAEKLIANIHGGEVFVEVIRLTPGLQRQEVFEKISALAAQGESGLLSGRYSAKNVRGLIGISVDTDETSFAKMLLEKLEGDIINLTEQPSSSLVVANLLEHPDTKDKVHELLAPQIPTWTETPLMVPGMDPIFKHFGVNKQVWSEKKKGRNRRTKGEPRDEAGEVEAGEVEPGEENGGTEEADV